MIKMCTQENNLFQHGATWLRADFHLHTKADGEFSYSGEQNDFITDYVDALENANIRIGVITNHNKFTKAEFDALRKKAKKKAIFLLPGIELSVNDGGNGIHTLIIFSDEWLTNGQDYINQFLNIAFEGKTPDQYENENARCSLGLIDTIKKLEGYHKDFFLVKNTYPAEIEGSDPKNLESIGKGQQRSYLKVGEFSFNSVKFALIDHENRVNPSVEPYKHSYIRSIQFEGGTLAGKTIYFSPELNTFIGIRGSGKSSILEVLRYVLDIPVGEKAGDQKYKQKLIDLTMGSGGKVIINAVDRNGLSYEIRRIWKENYSTVYIDNKLQPGVSIRETVLHKPIYFGQKDLASTGDGFEKDLVEKLLGDKLDDIRRKIAEQKINVSDAVDRLTKIANVQDQIAEQNQIKLDTEHRLQFFKDHGIEEKLQKRLDFDSDLNKMKKGVDLVKSFNEGITNLLAQHEDDLLNFQGYVSKHNDTLFRQFFDIYGTVIQFLHTTKAELQRTRSIQNDLSEKHQELITIRQGLVDEFAEIERKLADELKTSANTSVSSDEFLKLKQKLTHTVQLLSALTKQSQQTVKLEAALKQELQLLNDLWHQEFMHIKTVLDEVSHTNSALLITAGYKEDKRSYLDFMKSLFKGSGLRDSTYQGLIQQYPDFMAIYTDFDKAKSSFGTNPQILADLFIQNLKVLLTFQTPNKFTISYRGKELQHHSLGQRASALILFILSQQENDVIIIDQPEDDLDNQTIYEDVIKLVRQMKPKVQFIFATHNPNIPVLGDAEQIHACSFMDNTISVQSGGIDDQAQQKTIVEIMEGGKEAFNRRKEIYQIWKP